MAVAVHRAGEVAAQVLLAVGREDGREHEARTGVPGPAGEQEVGLHPRALTLVAEPDRADLLHGPRYLRRTLPGIRPRVEVVHVVGVVGLPNPRLGVEELARITKVRPDRVRHALAGR